MIIRSTPSSSLFPLTTSPLIPFCVTTYPIQLDSQRSNPVTKYSTMLLPLTPLLCFHFLTVPYMYPLLLFHFLFLHCNFSLSLISFHLLLQFFPFSYSIFPFFTHIFPFTTSVPPFRFHFLIFPFLRFHFPFTPLPFSSSLAHIFPICIPFFPSFAQVQYLPLHCSP